MSCARGRETKKRAAVLAPVTALVPAASCSTITAIAGSRGTAAVLQHNSTTTAAAAAIIYALPAL
jgi:hypothetical protein